MLPALLIAQAVALSRVSPAELLQAKHAIPALLGRLHRGEVTAGAKPGAAPLERFLAAYGNADSDAAWKLFKRLQQDEPELPWGETGMGRVYVEWRLWDQAAGAFARALSLAPGFPLALVERALSWRASGQPERAREDARAALGQDPNDARAILILAALDQDERLYAQALRLAPELYEAGAALAAIAERRGDLAAALAALEKLAEAAPRDARVQQQIAGLRVRTGDPAGAAQALENAVALGLASKETLAELARLQQRLGHRDEEERALLRLRRLAPRERGPLVRLSQLHAADPSADARALLALDSHDALGHLLLAQGPLADDARLAELTAAAQGHGDKATKDQGRARAEALRDELGVPQQPIAATTVNGLYSRASNVITRAYEKRRAAAPDLRGKLELKVRVNAAGSADSVVLVEDELRDKPLAACVSATLKEAQYPVRKTTLDFKFDLRPPK